MPPTQAMTARTWIQRISRFRPAPSRRRRPGSQPWVLLLQLEGDRDRFAGLDRHLLLRRPEGLVPDLEAVCPRWHILNLEAALLVGHGNVRTVRHHDPPGHPRMGVAGDLHDLGLLKFHLHLLPKAGLGLVEGRVLLPVAVEVVQNAVTVQDRDLPGGRDEDVGAKRAALLIKGCPFAVPLSLGPFHGDHGPLDPLARLVHHEALIVDRRLAADLRVLGGRNHLRGGRIAGKLHYAGNRPASSTVGGTARQSPQPETKPHEHHDRHILSHRTSTPFRVTAVRGLTDTLARPKSASVHLPPGSRPARKSHRGRSSASGSRVAPFAGP